MSAAVVTFAILGLASWYGEQERGKLMANGQPFDPDALTCAVQGYAFGTQLRIEHGGRTVVVTVTDRLGPAALKLGRELDLSRTAFAQLADIGRGVIEVRYSISAATGAVPVSLTQQKPKACQGAPTFGVLPFGNRKQGHSGETGAICTVAVGSRAGSRGDCSSLVAGRDGVFFSGACAGRVVGGESPQQPDRVRQTIDEAREGTKLIVAEANGGLSRPGDSFRAVRPHWAALVNAATAIARNGVKKCLSWLLPAEGQRCLLLVAKNARENPAARIFFA
jgi:rare lipoprotein A